LPLARIYLDGSAVNKFEAGVIYIGIKEKYVKDAEKLRQPSNIKIILKALNKLLSGNAEIQFEKLNEAEEQISSPVEEIKTAKEEHKKVELNPTTMKEWQGIDAVKDAMDIFQAEIMDVEDN